MTMRCAYGLLALVCCGLACTSGGSTTDLRVGDAGRARDARGAEQGPDGASPSCAAVTLAFTGTAVTISKTPLGFDDSLRGSAVTGTLAYRPCLADKSPDDPRRGVYEHQGGGAFSLSVGGKSVTGSESPVLHVEDYTGADTFRWLDGPQLADKDKTLRVMKLDGVRDPALKVTFAVTDGAGSALSGDRAPTNFPYPDLATKKYPHTFSVVDGGGTLLLQLSSLEQK